MIFELSIARKYLLPKKKQLSLSLIALMSVGVIALVVWLVLLFFSVTDGIEKNWLGKLTSLNAPIRITPTSHYYNSYYYLIDSLSEARGYQFKTIGEKAAFDRAEAYSPLEDPEIPSYFPERVKNEDGLTKDLVGELFSALKTLHLPAEEYESAGALLKLSMLRSQGKGQEQGENRLTQLSYISTFGAKSPQLAQLIQPLRMEDLNHLLFLSARASQEEGEMERRRIAAHLKVERVVKRGGRWKELSSLLPEGSSFDVYGVERGGSLSHLLLPLSKRECSGQVQKRGDLLHYVSKEGSYATLPLSFPLLIEERLPLEVTAQNGELRLTVEGALQGERLMGEVSFEGIEIEAAEMTTHFEREPELSPLWPYFVKEEARLPQAHHPAALLPKTLQKSGVRVGDHGYFSYSAMGASAAFEQRLPFTVVGFYDPGPIAVGSRLILTESAIPHAINASCSTLGDPQIGNGVQVYLKECGRAKEVKRQIERELERRGLSPYFEVASFHDYEFAKDLVQQFQSDKYLFTLIAVILLIVACSNIISLLVILVNDKKKEIAILSAMGASKRRIALIFTLCGALMGVVSTLIGTSAALLTLHYLDQLVHLLSLLQGHDAFNSLFYGNSLPKELSARALTFILIATPLISLIAALVPATRATKLHPSPILRGD